MSKKLASYLASFISVAVPSIAFAAGQTLADVIYVIIFYLNEVLVLMMGVAVVIFVYYIIKYFVMADAERKEAGPYVMWSLIGFFVILSFWGLVNILQNTFNLKNEYNQPASWTSFKGLFPGGSSSYSGGGSTGSSYSGGGSTGSNSYNGSGSTAGSYSGGGSTGGVGIPYGAPTDTFPVVPGNSRSPAKYLIPY